MTRTLSLELTTKQINILFRGLDLLNGFIENKNDSKEIGDLIRYIDKKVFGENN